MTPFARASARLERSSPLVLDQPVIELLARVFHLHVPGVKLYANEAANTLAQAAGADALAYPDRIVFRGGALDQRSPMSLALLGHELTHVAQLRARPPGSRSPDAGERAAEEREALHTERTLLRSLTVIEPRGLAGGPRYAPISLPPPPEPWRGAPLTTQSPAVPLSDRPAQAPLSTPSGGGHGPRAAAQMRDLGPAPPPTTAAALSAAELRALKEEIFRELRARIRVEAERGA